MLDAPEQVARVTAHAQQAREWSLVLAAAGIPHEVRSSAGLWLIAVPETDRDAAAIALDAYDHETPLVRAEAPSPPEYGPTDAGIFTALALLGFYAVLAHRADAQHWYDRGVSSAPHLRIGQTWRVVTALTLHADIAHVVSNAAACGVFGTALCRALGPGVGVWALLLSGAGANLLTAIVRDGGHRAVGASGAMFGAVGVLGALQFLHRYRLAESRRRAWVPMAAAVALLTLLGSSPGTDVIAHAFGFLLGGLCGLALATAVASPPRPLVQHALAAAALAFVVAAWALALR